MSIRSYYRWALLLPLAVPLVASALLLFPERPLADAVVLYLYWSLMIGGAPYLLFATGFLLWSRGRSDGELRRAVLVSPLVYAAVLTASLAVFLAVDAGLGNNLEFLAGMAGFGIAFGYGYVLLAEVGRRILHPAAATAKALPAA